MLSQCPECKTVFRVRPDQLKAAKGKVRCSRCQAVFSALEHSFHPAIDEPDKSHAAGSSDTDPRPKPVSDTASREQSPASPAKGPRVDHSGQTTSASVAEARDKSGAKNSTAISRSDKSLSGKSTNKRAPANPSESRRKAPGKVQEKLKTVSAADTPLPPNPPEWEQAERLDQKVTEKQATPSKPKAAAKKSETQGDQQSPSTHVPTSPAAAEEESPLEPAPSKPATRNDATPSSEEKEAPSSRHRPSHLPEAETEGEPLEAKSKVTTTVASLETTASDGKAAKSETSEDEEATSPTAKTPSLQKGQTTTEEEDFESSLFGLFDEDADESQNGLAESASAGEEPPARKRTAPSPARPQENSTAASRHSAADDNWDLFSDENIEAVQGPYSEKRGQEPAPTETPPQEYSSPHEAGDGEATGRQSDESSAEEQTEPASSLKDESGHETENSTAGQQTATDGKPPRESYTLPPQFQQRPGHSILRSTLWGGGILLLLLTLVSQYYFFYQRDILAEKAVLRPLLSQLCELTGCTLPPRRALSRIELADHLMQTHPRYEGSLLITAILVNRADFTQPFPVVEVIMTDLQQKVVARRHFRPEQYLIGDSRDSEFIPNTEIPLMLEVADPGDNAVGFEFNFY